MATPTRVLRISDDLWLRAGIAAAREGVSVSQYIRESLVIRLAVEDAAAIRRVAKKIEGQGLDMAG